MLRFLLNFFCKAKLPSSFNSVETNPSAAVKPLDLFFSAINMPIRRKFSANNLFFPRILSNFAQK